MPEAACGGIVLHDLAAVDRECEARRDELVVLEIERVDALVARDRVRMNGPFGRRGEN
jgi:hypothetical protein